MIKIRRNWITNNLVSLMATFLFFNLVYPIGLFEGLESGYVSF